MAKTLGATETLLVRKEDKEEDIVKKIHGLMGCEPEKSLDCSGMESTIRAAILVIIKLSITFNLGKIKKNINYDFIHFYRPQDLEGL